MKIKITVGHLTLEAELYNNTTAAKIVKILPFTTSFDTWGDEIYFAVPVDADLDENAREEVNIGDMGYWPTGRAFCIFFGPTPVSSPGKIKPASAVNIIGRVTGDAERLREVIHEDEIRLSY